MKNRYFLALNSWRKILVNTLTFSVLGILFFQNSRVYLTVILLMFAWVTVLITPEMRKSLGRIFDGHAALDLRLIAWPFLAWFFAAVISGMLSPLPFRVASLEGSLRFTLALGLLALTLEVRPDVRYLLWGLCIAAVAVFGFALHGWLILDLDRVGSWGYSAGRFGGWAMLIAGLLVLISALSTNMRLPVRLALLFFASLALFAGVLSGTRGSIVPLMILLIMLLLMRKDQYHKLLVYGGVVIAAISIALVANSPSLQQDLRITEAKQDLRGISNENYATSIGARVVMAEVAWTMFKRHPLTGLGVDTFQAEMKRMVEQGEVPPTQQYFRFAHSDMLHYLGTQGIVGLLAYICIMVGALVFFVCALRQSGADAHKRTYAGAGLLTTITLCCFGIFANPLIGYSDSTTYSLLICALAAQLLPTSHRFQNSIGFEVPLKT